jgi:hypothetical protein
MEAINIVRSDMVDSVKGYINVNNLPLSGIKYEKNVDGSFSTFLTRNKGDSFEVLKSISFPVVKVNEVDVKDDGSFFYVDNAWWKAEINMDSIFSPIFQKLAIITNG